jgi:hypothetical protein
VAEAFWHERHGETPAREIHSDPTDIDREYYGYDGRDRYGYDERDRVVIAYRAGKPGEEPTVECVASPGADGAV